MSLTVLVIQGGSATGKTTLATKLAKDLKMLLLTKDNFKELFYDTLGTPETRDESTLYGLSATKALYAAADVFMGGGKSVILESAFTKGRAEADIQDIIKDKSINLIQLHVTASPEVRLKRYEDRIQGGQRHKGHPDASGSVSVSDFSNDGDRYGALDIDATIEVNTDTFNEDDYNNLLSSVKKTIGEN